MSTMENTMNESANTLLLAALLMVGGVNSRFLTVHPANADSRPSPHMMPGPDGYYFSTRPVGADA